jgi:hypothetical protein
MKCWIETQIWYNGYWQAHINHGLLRPSHTRTYGSFMMLVMSNGLMHNKVKAFDCDFKL